MREARAEDHPELQSAFTTDGVVQNPFEPRDEIRLGSAARLDIPV